MRVRLRKLRRRRAAIEKESKLKGRQKRVEGKFKVKFQILSLRKTSLYNVTDLVLSSFHPCWKILTRKLTSLVSKRFSTVLFSSQLELL